MTHMCQDLLGSGKSGNVLVMTPHFYSQAHMMDGKGTVVSVFLADMLNTMIREIVQVFHVNMSKQVDTGKTHLGLFLILVGVSVILLSAIVNLCFICHGISNAKIAAFKFNG